MARFAIVENNNVTNVIIAEPDFAIDGVTLVQIDDNSMVSPGWLYIGNEFVEPQIEEPALEQTSPTPPSGELPVTEL